jgi:general secretion pathway protein C
MRRLVALAVLCIAATAAADPNDPSDPPLLPCRPPSPQTVMWLTFKRQTSIQDLAVWMTVTYCKNVAFDAAIERSGIGVTVLAPNKLTPKQALQLVIDAIEATGVVVVQKPDTIIIKLGPNMSRPCAGVAGSAPPTVSTTDPTAEPPSELGSMDEMLAAGIKKIDETHYEIRTSLVDAILLNPMAAAKSTRVVPAMKNGKPEGLKLYAIRPSSIFARLGFANGDTVLTINKHRIDSADKALEAYTQLREAKRLEVELIRRGTPVTLTFTVTP